MNEHCCKENNRKKQLVLVLNIEYAFKLQFINITKPLYHLFQVSPNSK
jgi:hypothetical protein